MLGNYLNVGAPIADSQLNNGLANWWLPSPNRCGSRLFDIKGGATGTLTSITTWRAGYSPQFPALPFDGSASRVVCGTVAAYNKPCTMEAVIYPDSLATTRTIFGFYNGGGSGAGNLQFRVETSGALRLVKQGIADIGSGTAGVVTTNKWHHVIATYDSSGNFAFYCNGVAAGSGTNNQTMNTTSLDFGVGDFASEWFSGLMTCMSIRNYAAPSSVCLALYAQWKRDYVDMLRSYSRREYLFNQLTTPNTATVFLMTA